jgi:hypothetical protein
MGHKRHSFDAKVIEIKKNKMLLWFLPTGCFSYEVLRSIELLLAL